jgi:hypothetical protein
MAPNHWRTRLEALWTRTVDEIILLSQAGGGDAPHGAAGTGPAALAGSSRRLTSRLKQAYQDLNEIADAVDRLDAGHFGVCANCLRPMPHEWLAEAPQIGFCPDCSLDLVCWRPAVPAGVLAMRKPASMMLAAGAESALVG